MARTTVHTAAAPKAIGTYSQAVRCGATVYLAGQIGLDPATMEIVAGIEPADTTASSRTCRRSRRPRAAASSDVVKLTVYLTDLGNFARVNEIMAAYFTRALSRARRGRRREPAARRAGGGGCDHAPGSEASERVMSERRECCGSGRAPATPSPVTRIRPITVAALSRSTLAQLAKLGIASEFDLVLHLPLRYDDETPLYPINAAPAGEPVLVEGTVVEADVQYRPRRQLVCHIEDGTGVLGAALLQFLPEPVEAARAGHARARFRRDPRRLPRRRDGPPALPRRAAARRRSRASLTPVYPTTAGLRPGRRCGA